MSAPSETYDIDCFGDILLVLISGDSQSNLAAQEENISASFSESDTLLDDASFLDSSLVDGVLTSDASQSPSTIVNHEPRRAVRFRVASHRLRRSSPVFEQLLYQYVGYPGAAYQSHYPIRIPIWNDDPPIMDLMLRIIHKDDPFETQDQDISQLFPSTECLLDHIDLETLARIATVADKYQLHSSLDFWLTKWVDEIWDNMEESSMSEALDWVWVAWAFDLTDHFSAATAYVAKSSAEPVEGNDDFEYSCPTDVLSKHYP
ncbi:hypothetical protein FOQG_18021 [Fusarium oxysporum f. sp. raphani 54005]|uniref:BTB domain-containing protein n=2 Tax=Fusarium oxysporum f. sp. raphani TaxID=96318 RepID=X0B686_FUSOX|nr:hypothetical protein FOQG_18021 [Fusarium oxysporum f. sp. raphani 54005]KAG7431881.1 hypothetical protein Forpi1262_v007028 [Fusarium oxysporum f. sp. raphani]